MAETTENQWMLESCLHLQYLADHVDLRHPTRHHHHRTSHRKSHSRKRMHRMKIHCHQLPAKKVKVTLFKSEARYSGIISGRENLVYLGFSKILQTGLEQHQHQEAPGLLPARGAWERPLCPPSQPPDRGWVTQQCPGWWWLLIRRMESALQHSVEEVFANVAETENDSLITVVHFQEQIFKF